MWHVSVCFWIWGIVHAISPFCINLHCSRCCRMLFWFFSSLKSRIVCNVPIWGDRVFNKVQELGKYGQTWYQQSFWGVPAFSFVNCVGSAVARKSGLGVYTYVGREHAVASTKAFMNQVACLSLVPGYFLELKEESHAKQRKFVTFEYSFDWGLTNIVDALLRLTACINISLRRREQCKETAQKVTMLWNSAHFLLLNKVSSLRDFSDETLLLQISSFRFFNR